jgi:hypothetical protein
MSRSDELQVVTALMPRGRAACCLHGPDDPCVEDVWLLVQGPASYVVWRQLARRATRSPRATVTIAEVAASTGWADRKPTSPRSTGLFGAWPGSTSST